MRVPNQCDPVPGLCTPEGFCWENQRPQGNDVRGLYTTDERSTWLTTDNGSILFFDGERTSMVAVPTQSGIDLRAIHGCGPNDIYAVGDFGTVLHFDGGSWAVEPLPTVARPDLTFVQCIDNGRAVTGRNNNELYLRDATGTWSVRMSSTNGGSHRATVLGNAIYLMTDTGLLQTLDVSGWVPVPGPSPASSIRGLKAVAGRLYALGSDPTPPIPPNNTSAARLAEFSPDAGTWQVLLELAPLAIGDFINGFDTLDGETFWLVGNNNTVRRFTRDGGLEPRLLNTVDPRTLQVVASLGNDRAFVAGSSGVYVHVFDGGASSTAFNQRLGPLGKLCVTPASGTQPPAFVAPQGGNSGLVRNAATPIRWESLDSPNQTRATNWLGCAFASPTSFALAGSDGGLAFGSNPVQSGVTTFFDLAGGAGIDWNRAWWSGSHWYFLSTPRAGRSLLLRTDGGSSDLITLDGGYVDLFGTGSTAVMVGDGGAVSTFNGTNFVRAPNPTTASLTAAHVSPDGGSMVAVGPAGVWLSRSGTTPFSNQAPFTTSNFTGVWRSVFGETWFVGSLPDGGPSGGMLFLRLTDGGVRQEPLPLQEPPSSIVGVDDVSTGRTTVWVSGRGGAILRRDPKDGG